MVVWQMIFVYPGSFDPITNGHLDIIFRAAKICGKLIVAVGSNESKKPAFSVEERIELINCALAGREDIVVTSFSGLLADFVKRMGAKTVIKGLRAMSDFEYEFQMALLNKNLEPDMETLFMMTNVNYSYLSSSAVKEIAKNGGKIDGLVPECIKDRIIKKLTCKQGV
jgi:pantetheine-phosphate adenylyltransferase